MLHCLALKCHVQKILRQYSLDAQNRSYSKNSFIWWQCVRSRLRLGLPFNIIFISVSGNCGVKINVQTILLLCRMFVARRKVNGEFRWYVFPGKCAAQNVIIYIILVSGNIDANNRFNETHQLLIRCRAYQQFSNMIYFITT